MFNFNNFCINFVNFFFSDCDFFYVEFFFFFFIVLLVFVMIFLQFFFKRKKIEDESLIDLRLLKICFNISILLISFIFIGYLNFENVNGIYYCFNKIFELNYFIFFIKIVLIFFFFVYLLILRLNIQNLNDYRYESVLFLLIAFFALLLLVMVNNMMYLYILVELYSLVLYILIGFNRNSLKSTEAALKYFILNALATAFMLYGISLLYGFTGLLNFDDIRNFISIDYILRFGNEYGQISIGIILIFCSFFFKIGIAPFHMWLPDVYEGSPLFVFGFLLIFSKLSLVFFLIKISSFVFSVFYYRTLVYILLAGSFFSIMIGTLGMLACENLYRFIAYSSINHMGFILFALSSNTVAGISAAFFYLLVYIFLVFMFFVFCMSIFGFSKNVTSVYDLAKLRENNFVLSFCLSMIFFSMAGLPVFAGFFSKFIVIYSVMCTGISVFVYGSIWVFFFMLLNSFAYMRLIVIIFFGSVEDESSLPVVFFINNKFCLYLLFFGLFINLFFFLFVDFFYLSVDLSVLETLNRIRSVVF